MTEFFLNYPPTSRIAVTLDELNKNRVPYQLIIICVNCERLGAIKSLDDSSVLSGFCEK